MTPEDRAAGMVYVEPRVRGLGFNLIIAQRSYSYQYEENAKEDAKCICSVIASAIREAVAEALSAGMPGSPLSSAELDAIRARVDAMGREAAWGKASADFVVYARHDVPALLAHIDHLEGLLRDLAQDDAGAAYRRGHADGLRSAEVTP